MTPASASAIASDRALAPLTSWQIGGPAAYFAEPSDPEALSDALRFAHERDLPVLALGGASNMLIADTGFPGLVIRYLDRSQILEEMGSTAHLRAGAGVLFSRLARTMARAGWAGLEWAEGIPGTLGGAIAGNAGAFGSDVSSHLISVRVLGASGAVVDVPVVECGFAYRTSRFKKEGLSAGFILGGSLRLTREDPEVLRQRLKDIASTRRRNSPTGLSCGSVFKNPPGQAAGRLIEEAGLKGAEEGPAQVSPKHGNYIVNRGGASAEQILALIDRMRAAVRERTGIELELEVRLVGFETGLGTSLGQPVAKSPR